MPTLDAPSARKPIKLLNLGESGTGKTGALGSLVRDAGQRLVILDFDNGLSILRDPKVIPVDARPRVFFKTFTERWKVVNGTTIIDGSPRAFSDAMKMLTVWKDEEMDLGKITEWDSSTTVVIDSFSFMAKAAFNMVLAMVGRLNVRPQLQDWGQGQDLIERTLELLYSDAVRCNVVVNCHIQYIESEEGAVLRGLPMALGKALSPKIPRYFDFVIQSKTKGSGANAKRVLLTQPQAIVELKLPILEGLPAELPLDTGLGTIFNHFLKENKA